MRPKSASGECVALACAASVAELALWLREAGAVPTPACALHLAAVLRHCRRWAAEHDGSFLMRRSAGMRGALLVRCCICMASMFGSAAGCPTVLLGP